MAMAMQSGEKSRFSDVCDEPIDHLLSPIRGYEDKPLLPLNETIEPVSGYFNEIEDNVFVALHNCQNPADGLTQQESAAIHLYTMQFHGGSSLYLLLNRSLRAENREELKPWFSFLKLFLTSLYKLPSQCKTVWRGVKNVNLSSIYKKGTKFAWWGVSSCTLDIEILQSNAFLGKHGERTLFSIECINGKSAANHSYFRNTEKEIILMPGSYFEVMGQLNPAPQLYIIQLKEITPPITLVKPPFSTSTNINSPSVVNESNTFLQPTLTEQNPVSNIIPNQATTLTSEQLFSPHTNQKWIQNGINRAGGHGQGNGLNQLYYPQGMYIDDDQTIYVADTFNNRIVEWKSDATRGQVVAGGYGQLNHPTNVMIDKENDCLIICDKFNRRVVRWPRRNGTSGETIISNVDSFDLTMDKDGYLFVSDYEKHEVRRWKMGDMNGTIVAGGNGSGNRLDQLSHPNNIFVDEDHSVYVSDCFNHRVMKWMKDAKEGIVVAGGQDQGNGLRQLSYPYGIIVDQLGTVYVADSNNLRVMRWLKGAQEGTIVVTVHGRGGLPSQFHGPIDLFFDRQNNLYVLDFDNNRVQKFDINLN